MKSNDDLVSLHFRKLAVAELLRKIDDLPQRRFAKRDERLNACISDLCDRDLALLLDVISKLPEVLALGKKEV